MSAFAPSCHYTGESEERCRHSHTEHRLRIERFSKQMVYTDAFALLSKFYTEKHANASESFNKGKSDFYHV